MQSAYQQEYYFMNASQNGDQRLVFVVLSVRPVLMLSNVITQNERHNTNPRVVILYKSNGVL